MMDDYISGNAADGQVVSEAVQRALASAEADDATPRPVKRYRTIFISDFHMGTRGCKAAFLADFLKATSCDYLFLVGDIVDGWKLRKSWYWDRDHDRILRRILKKAKNRTKVTYIPGNHDEALRKWIPFGFEIAGIKFSGEAVHTLLDGRKLLVTHGDDFDSVVRHAKILAHLGDSAYRTALVANHWFNIIRRSLGYPYWSLSAWLKQQVKSAVNHIDKFEQTLADRARVMGLNGVVCGHIHKAEMRDIGGVIYLNDGDWVESCTALVENLDGTLEIITWTGREAKDGAPAVTVEPTLDHEGSPSSLSG